MQLAESLNWATATKEHKSSINQFICTDPSKLIYEPNRGKHHPRAWELEVQSVIRNLKLPPGRKDEAVLLGTTKLTGEIAAVSYFGFDETGDQMLIWAIATAKEYQGSGIGREILGKTLLVLRTFKTEISLDCGIFTRIHTQNEPSKRLFGAAGFEFLGKNTTDPNLEDWVTS